MTSKLYVGNLPFTVTEDALNQLFAEVGAVQSAKVVLDKMTGKSKGFGFVEYSNEDDARKAIDKFNGYELDGRTIKVSEARPREETGGGGGGGGPRFRSHGGGGGPRGGGGGDRRGGNRGGGGGGGGSRYDRRG